ARRRLAGRVRARAAAEKLATLVAPGRLCEPAQRRDFRARRDRRRRRPADPGVRAGRAASERGGSGAGILGRDVHHCDRPRGCRTLMWRPHSSLEAKTAPVASGAVGVRHLDFLRRARGGVTAPQILGFRTFGFPWNSLDSLDRNEPFQWVTRIRGNRGRFWGGWIMLELAR